ncbi:MAG: hypothetical protein IJ629_02450 [Clostridia bacterium]|nr:hypothetical protein [Clostridia bacterium]
MKKKILFSLYISFCIIFVFTNVCYGYLDPSAMTYVIQVVAAIFIAISTSIGILFYKIKRKFFHKKKNKESTIEEINDETETKDEDNIEK